MNKRIIVIFLIIISSFSFTKIAFANQHPVGFLDIANCDTIAGWAYDPDTPTQAIDVHVYKDGVAGKGTFVIEATASDVRADVNNILRIPGNHGFNIQTPDSLKDGQAHLIYVHGIDSWGNNNFPAISNPPIVIQCSTPEVVVPGESTAPTPEPTIAPTPELTTPEPTPFPNPGLPPAITGFVDLANCNSISGWAADKNNPSIQISIELLADNSYTNGGKLIGQKTTNIVRPDVNNALGISGTHGFSWATPDSLKDGASHQLFIYATNDNRNYTPLKFSGPTPSVKCGTATASTSGSKTTPRISQSSGPVGSKITISGLKLTQKSLNFSNSAIQDLNPILSPDGSSLTVSVPNLSPGTYPIYITNSDGSISNLSFTVTSGVANTPSPTPTHITPQGGNGPPRSAQGVLDGVTPDVIFGWAYDPTKYGNNRPAVITLYFDANSSGAGASGFVQFTTNVYRPDVNASLGISGNHGFKYRLYSIPSYLKDGKDHKVIGFVAGVSTPLGPIILPANLIMAAHAPDPTKYDGLIEEIKSGIDNLPSALQKALDGGLTIVESGNTIPASIAIYNPEIPGQLLLTITIEEELKAPQTFQNVSAVCFDGANPIKIVTGKILALNGGPNDLHVSCAFGDSLCNRIDNDTKNVANNLNTFFDGIPNVPKLSYSYLPSIPNMIGLGGVEVMVVNKSEMSRPDAVMDTTMAIKPSKLGFPYAVIKVNRDLMQDATDDHLSSILMHELLHTFGFKDSLDPSSIMYGSEQVDMPNPDERIAQTVENIYGQNPVQVNNCKRLKVYNAALPELHYIGDPFNKYSDDGYGWLVDPFLFFDLPTGGTGNVTTSTCWWNPEKAACEIIE